MFLARVERLPVTSRSHVTDVTDVTDKCKISMMMMMMMMMMMIDRVSCIILLYMHMIVMLLNQT